jgi:hypothetical protein
MQDDHPDQELSEGKIDGPRESTLSSDIEEDDLNHQQKDLLLGHIRGKN